MVKVTPKNGGTVNPNTGPENDLRARFCLHSMEIVAWWGEKPHDNYGHGCDNCGYYWMPGVGTDCEYWFPYNEYVAFMHWCGSDLID